MADNQHTPMAFVAPHDPSQSIASVERPAGAKHILQPDKHPKTTKNGGMLAALLQCHQPSGAGRHWLVATAIPWLPGKTMSRIPATRRRGGVHGKK